jgi:hypothetical protein
MDFYKIRVKPSRKKDDPPVIVPEFIVRPSKDLLTRGGTFYAIWDEEANRWSTDVFDVVRLIDKDLWQYQQEKYSTAVVKTMENYSTSVWTEFNRFLSDMPSTNVKLDEKVTFLSQETKRSDHASKRLSYDLVDGECVAYDELISTLYDPEERDKLEWAIGAILTGDSRNLQKFIVLYGEMGSGKSTFLHIVEKLFDGYWIPFDAKSITSSGNQFAMSMFKEDPLIGIQHDGDLSRIEDNTKLNSIVSHEMMTINEKYKGEYRSKTNTFLFMGTNRPVKITDGKSGIIRRLIDVSPSGRKVSERKYDALTQQIDFELGAIANYCIKRYRALGKNYYTRYRSTSMMLKTDVFYNFVEDNYYIFKEQDGVGVTQAYAMYKVYCDESLVEFKLPLYKFREELKNYFRDYTAKTRIDGQQLRSWYSGFLSEKFQGIEEKKPEPPVSLSMEDSASILDELLKGCPAQYATDQGTPKKRWSEVTTKLSDIDTTKVHYVKPPENHIVIDFDLKDDNGEKSYERCLDEASKWPSTYSELSKGGNGIHLHYIYTGDVTKLNNVYADGIEIKVFTGGAALRRKVTKCNNIPVAPMSGGLPLKGEKMINHEVVRNERNIRSMIERNLKKEFHPGTKPSIDFIYKILDDAYKDGVKFDVTDMRPKVLTFANKSTNQADYCIKLVNKMVFKSDEPSEPGEYKEDAPIVFFDIEVFPNLFVVVWKKDGGEELVRMINPKSSEIGQLLNFRLVGFNCRRYDNHVLYAAYIGYSIEELYNLSQKIINGSRNCMFGEAYNLSYADIYDFSNKKQSLKKFEIELGLHHQECPYKWDEPVPEDKWNEIADYCCNDVNATEATFHARKQDFVARQILAELSGLTVNDTTQVHASKIILEGNRKAKEHFVYADLSEMFPGYTFDHGKSEYRGINPSEGGYVYASPGMYGNVALLDIASMHPTSALELNIFGPYTKNFREFIETRLAIKHRDFEKAGEMFGGKIKKYLVSPDDADDLAFALKIVINSVYGYTSATFDSNFKDPRNKDNIVAKRGALFMIDLQFACKEKGYQVVHIKTDSIKIADATEEAINFVMEFGRKYGYTFEHEATYDRFCLLNDAVYVARDGTDPSGWTSTGTQLIHPYVFKTLFSRKELVFEDLCEAKSVTTSLYLDMNEALPEDEHEYHFVGKVGLFCPIRSGAGGGLLLREKEGKYYSATGAKGYRWLEAETVKTLGKEDDIDFDYFEKLAGEAKKAISSYGDFDWFVSEKPYDMYDNEIIPF